MSAFDGDAVYETWDGIYELTVQLSQRISGSGRQFDAIVVVPRGGYYPANIIARDFALRATDLLHACVSSYSKPGQRELVFEIGQMPSGDQIKGKDLLIIDDVCDTGNTLAYLTDHLMKNGARSVATGCLHYKPKQSQTDFVPDWYSTQTEEWIVYPWEVHDIRRESANYQAPDIK